MEKARAAAQKYFEQNGDVKVVYGTSDGFIFHARNYAEDHAATLEDTDVEPITPAGETEEVVELTEDQKALLEDLESADYNQIKDLVKVLGLKTENEKKATLMAALEAYKAGV